MEAARGRGRSAGSQRVSKSSLSVEATFFLVHPTRRDHFSSLRRMRMKVWGVRIADDLLLVKSNFLSRIE